MTFDLLTYWCNVVDHRDFTLSCDSLPVGVINHGIEALVDPLPEHDCRGGLVEGHHAARDGHVEGDLGRHPARQEHRLAWEQLVILGKSTTDCVMYKGYFFL